MRPAAASVHRKRTPFIPLRSDAKARTFPPSVPPQPRVGSVLLLPFRERGLGGWEDLVVPTAHGQTALLVELVPGAAGRLGSGGTPLGGRVWRLSHTQLQAYPPTQGTTTCARPMGAEAQLLFLAAEVGRGTRRPSLHAPGAHIRGCVSSLGHFQQGSLHQTVKAVARAGL